MESFSANNLLPHRSFYEVWPPPAIALAPSWGRYDDEKLLHLYQTGNAQESNDAFSAIYNRYREDVARYVGSVMESENEARDVFCDVWTKAALGLKEFTWQGTSPKNWLIKTARFTAYDLKRKKKDTVSFEDVAEQLEVAGPLDATTPLTELIEEEGQDEADQRFQQALSTLKNPLQKKILIERYFNGVTNSQEIAERLGVKSDSTIRGTLGRARKKLKKFFERIHSEKEEANHG